MSTKVTCEKLGIGAICALAFTVGLAACGSFRAVDQARLGGQAVDISRLTPGDVQERVVVVERDGSTIFQAPMLTRAQILDLPRSAPTLGSRTVDLQVLSGGYLYGERVRGSGGLRHYAVYQRNLVAGEDRYARVALTDGTSLPFQTSAPPPDPCVPNCFPIIQSVVVQIPDAALRGATQSGLVLIVTLDTGYAFRVTAPAAYVSGYLAAVDSGGS